MKGGMSRRYAFFQELHKKGWPLVALDVGGLARGYGRQAELKFQTLVESKLMMGYNAIAFGLDDLRLPVTELVSVAAPVENKPSPFISGIKKSDRISSGFSSFKNCHLARNLP